jgi:hypothetical protein
MPAPGVSLLLRAVVVLLAVPGAALAQNLLPPEVEAALVRAKLPREALGLVVVDAEGKSAPRLVHRAQVPMNPASVMKLVTTYAALDLLGPAYTWNTPAYIEGAVRDGTLYGNADHPRRGGPQAGAGTHVAAAAPRAGAGRAQHPWRHRARPQRVCHARGRPGRLRRRAAAPLQRRPRRTAAQLQVGGDDLCARPHRPDRPGAGRPAAGRCGRAGHVPLSGANAATTAAPCARIFQTRRGSALRAPTRPAARRRPGRSPMPTRAVIRCAPSKACGRPWGASWSARCGSANSPRRRHHACAGVRAGLAQPGRSDPRHQQVQQQRDGAAGVPDAGADAARQQWWRTRTVRWTPRGT